MFTPAETIACRRLIVLALEEDIGPGDVTSEAVIDPNLHGSATFTARSDGVVAGLPAAALVAEAIDGRLRFEPIVADGSSVAKGARLALISGPMRGILAAERLALNFLQHLSGVATLTRQYVDAIAGLRAKILDTRKTLPGWRLLEKYAVRMGGGHNHRIGLYDGILIKDNHLAPLPFAERRDKITEAVRLARAVSSLPIEIEVEDFDQLEAALRLAPQIVLLDNMSPEALRQAVRRRDELAPAVQLEASGGVNLQTVRAIAETGVERISVGALTHSAPALDIALDYSEPASPGIILHIASTA